MKHIRFVIAIGALVFLVAACGSMQQAELGDGVARLADSSPRTDGIGTSDNGVIPHLVNNPRRGGNVTCDDIGMNAEGSTPRMNFSSGTFSPALPGWLTVNVSGKSIEWIASDLPNHLPNGFIGAVIVKGGPSAHVYFYDPSGDWQGTVSDDGLQAPTMLRNGNVPGLSNITFCKKLKPPHTEDPVL